MLGVTRAAILAAAAACVCLSGAASAGTELVRPFSGTISRPNSALREWMTGRSWRQGCPVGLADLRLLTVTHYGFDGRAHVGSLIVHRRAARPLLRVMRTLYRARFPIRRMRPVDFYGADDFRSIEADNTSAFNCRFVGGTRRWSQHAYGLAIDVNPIENPYVTAAGQTAHTASRPYLDRSRVRPGMAHAGGSLVRAFAAIGWGWGGTWTGVKDYQHFSSTGR